jgi:peptidoglycan hydrolase-like protein with peptidoglycan-binding domain
MRWVQNTLNQVMSLRCRWMAYGTRDTQRHPLFQQKQDCRWMASSAQRPSARSAPQRCQSPDAQAEFEAFDTELADQEWQGEVSRSSSDYIKWVQRSLNQIMGLQLAVDGISGTQTRSAIRSFQQQRGLAVDGVVGPQTEQALIAAGAGNPPGAGAPSYTPPSTQPSTSSRAQLAQQVLNHNNISLWPYSPTDTNSSDGADAHSNVSAAASSRAATRSNYGNAPGGSVYLDTRMLDGMLKLANTYDIQVTSIAGGSHSSTSRHYAGVALDVNEINGVHVTSSNPYYRALMQKCRDLGATEVLGPGDAGHDTHVHCAWPRP